jgi:hypothetical protein
MLSSVVSVHLLRVLSFCLLSDITTYISTDYTTLIVDMIRIQASLDASETRGRHQSLIEKELPSKTEQNLEWGIGLCVVVLIPGSAAHRPWNIQLPVSAFFI